jgi:dihydroneopterin aldolase
VTIHFRDIQCYAYHGVLDEEKREGNTFRVGVSIVVDDPVGLQSDDIHDTLDYRVVSDIVAAEMNQPANLIEHVAWRIKNKLQQTFATATEIRVRVAKKSPPVSLPVDWVEVEV